MKFNHLLSSIQQMHDALQSSAIAAVNRSLTIRNWLIGFYIVEFEQKGEDRAQYGEELLQILTMKIDRPGLSARTLRLFRQFYQVYPQLQDTLFNELRQIRSLPQLVENQSQIWQTVSAKSIESPLHSIEKVFVPADKILNRLSFSHIAELLPIEDPLKRAFYEIECMKGTWSVRELKRQINSLYFERSGLSQQPEKLSAMVAEKAEPMQPADIIKSVYRFKFVNCTMLLYSL